MFKFRKILKIDTRYLNFAEKHLLLKFKLWPSGVKTVRNRFNHHHLKNCRAWKKYVACKISWMKVYINNLFKFRPCFFINIDLHASISNTYNFNKIHFTIYFHSCERLAHNILIICIVMEESLKQNFRLYVHKSELYKKDLNDHWQDNITS